MKQNIYDEPEASFSRDGGSSMLLETPRLRLRPLSMCDVPSLAAILADPAVMKHSVGGVCDELATRDFINWCLESYAAHGVGSWALVDKNDSSLIGFCSVGPELVNGVEEMNLGYRLATRYWNKGLATEAAKAVLAHAFRGQGMGSVIVIIEPDHVASLKVAENAGFRQFHSITFHGRSVRLYRLRRADWLNAVS